MKSSTPRGLENRAVPEVEAVTAAVLLDMLLEGNHGTF